MRQKIKTLKNFFATSSSKIELENYLATNFSQSELDTLLEYEGLFSSNCPRYFSKEQLLRFAVWFLTQKY